MNDITDFVEPATTHKQRLKFYTMNWDMVKNDNDFVVLDFNKFLFRPKGINKKLLEKLQKFPLELRRKRKIGFFLIRKGVILYDINFDYENVLRLKTKLMEIINEY